MATIQLKRSNTAGANPTTSNLALGELGINTKDGKFFLRKHVDGNTSGDTILTYAPQGINPFGTQKLPHIHIMVLVVLVVILLMV